MEKDLEMFRQRLISNATASELKFCNYLDALGIKYEFQKILHGRIVDFYFPALNKIIELDGKHFHDPAKDSKRDKFLKEKGLVTYRIRSHRVFTEPQAILAETKRFLANLPKKKRSKKSLRKAAKRNRAKAYQPLQQLEDLHASENYKNFLLKIGD